LTTELSGVGDLEANGCPANGNGCKHVYAVSIRNVTPARGITWFQATAAARNAGKRLPTNAEWQAGALGTPDPGDTPGADDCNTVSGVLTPTGSRRNCQSDVGAFDMVGNVSEWVADWMPLSTVCPGWGAFSDDEMCLAGVSETSGPGALVRGGDNDVSSSGGALAGVFAVMGILNPSRGFNLVGFRAAR
jgi:formylglycine-generating enzyme required for sulfatase activity